MPETQVETSVEVITQPRLIADDDRGVIEQLDAKSDLSILRITSKKGTVRANHYHQKDSHTCYLVSGKIRYVERDPADASAPLTEYIIEPGQLFYTAPMIAHAMEFLEDSVFFAFTPRSGEQKEYENDVIRVTLIDPADALRRAQGKTAKRAKSK